MKHSIRVRLSGYITVAVDLPEHPNAAEIEAAEERAKEIAEDPNIVAVEAVDTEWIGGRPSPSLVVTEDSWVTLPDGTRWATEGWCAIREGAPTPTMEAWWAGWIKDRKRPPPSALAGLLARRKPVSGVAWVHRRFGPLLRAGRVERCGGPKDHIIIHDERGPLAVVMPVRVGIGDDTSYLIRVAEDGTCTGPELEWEP